MKRLLVALALLILWVAPGRAQLGNFGDSPVEVDAEDQRFVNGLFVAQHNVVIRYADTTIYADYAEYSPETHDALVSGNVRVYRAGQSFTAERGLYNFETKVFRAADFRGESYPFKFSGETLGSMGAKDYLVHNGLFTTSDSSKPDYYLRAKTIRIYPKDRIVFSNVTLFVGTTPVFWWPYLYQSLKHEQAFTLTPGYRSSWGGFLLTSYTFPIAEHMSGKLHLDLYSDRGIGAGVDTNFSYGEKERNTGKFRSYYISDAQYTDSTTSTNKYGINRERYRVSLQHRLYLRDDIYANIDLNVLSDVKFLEDFFPGENRKDPQPDNMISVTKVAENYSITLIGRAQVNEWQETSERLPELVVDFKRSPIWNTGLYYEGESGVGYLRRNFEDGSRVPDYDYTRFDTFHQITYPQTYFGWLSLVPRLGARATYYTDSGRLETSDGISLDSLAPGTPLPATVKVADFGSAFRGVLNTGFEASFKFSREWETQSRAWGLDGLRHVVQPYTNLSIAMTNKGPDEIFQIDRFTPSTELPPIDFPQFNMVDSISDWSIWRWGVRNRLQTRRDNRTFNWLEMDTFLDVNLEKPDFPNFEEPGTFSNLHNDLRWQPLPWVGFRFDSQFPIDNGFTQLNTGLNLMVTRDFNFSVSHRYITNNPYFEDDNSLSVGGYYRLDDNWGLSFRDTYEFVTGTLERQEYQIHRDLSSWVASLGFIFRDKQSKDEFGVLLTFTLKDVPEISLPLSIDPGSEGF